MKRKRIFAVICCVLFLLSLASCNRPNGGAPTPPKESEPAEQTEPAIVEGSKTLLIYMCASNLETKQGLASKNIDELLSATVDEKTNIIIQTGGAKKWRKHGISATQSQRYIVKNGELVLLSSSDDANMGSAATLTDFLVWGQNNYLAERNMLILWDHGGGAAKGVCFDENYGFEPLSLLELKSALKNANLKNKFDIIGFDACLMACIETAALVQDYAEYMIASEEIEPSDGWDYKVLVESYASMDNALEVGKAVCDSYIEKCREKGKDLYSTLSVFDLSQTDDMLEQMEYVIKSLIANEIGSENASAVLSAMNSCEKFGGDNVYQGAANMLDLLDFVSKVIVNQSTNVVDVFIAGDHLVPYKVSGGRKNAKGVSFYYPIVYNEKEIRDYIAIGFNEVYNQFLSRLYLNVPENTIAFTDLGSVSENGAFTVTLTPGSMNYLNRIDFILMESDADGKRHILCTDNDMNKNWEDMIFRSNFRGIRLALDGHRLFYSSVSTNAEYVSFIAPVKVNGERTNLRFVFVWDSTKFNGGYYRLVGTCVGYDENGLPSNDIVPLKQGDRVQVITDTVLENGRTEENFSEEFTIGENGGEISEIPLDGKEYQYVFVATDIFGNTFTSDMATFEMTVSYDELLKNPLPDETFAAKVTSIEPYDQRRLY